jgi:hypothetical protein
MVHCPSCTDAAQAPQEAAVEMTHWTTEGTETLYRCPRCGWQEARSRPEVNQGDEPQDERRAS